MGHEGLDHFQDQTANLLLRHRSVLDVLSKLQGSHARTNRAITKAITQCGCLQVHAHKQPYTSAHNLEEAREQFDTHLKGHLCEHCREMVERELGNHLFYLASLCNLLDIRLNDAVEQESEKLSTLGLFNMS